MRLIDKIICFAGDVLLRAVLILLVGVAAFALSALFVVLVKTAVSLL